MVSTARRECRAIRLLLGRALARHFLQERGDFSLGLHDLFCDGQTLFQFLVFFLQPLILNSNGVFAFATSLDSAKSSVFVLPSPLSDLW